MKEVMEFLMSFLENDLYILSFEFSAWDKVMRYAIDQELIICEGMRDGICYFSLTSKGYDEISAFV